MSDLFVTEFGSYLAKSGESLLVKKESSTLLELELKHLESIQVFGNVSISTPLLQELMDRGIEFAYYTATGHLYGHVSPIRAKNVELRYAQYELSQSETFCLQIAKQLIGWKFEGCIRLLEEYEKNNDLVSFRTEVNGLREKKDSLVEVSNLSSLLGTEGNFAKQYYPLYGGLFKNSEIFKGRSRRPPLDVGNALLSFVYTMLTHKLTALADGIGLDPYLGFLHKMEYGRASLACDLIEPLRPLFCDWIVLKIFNLRMLQESDFEPGEEGGYYLTQEGKRRFFPLYYEELKKERDFVRMKTDLMGISRYNLDWMKQCLAEKTVVSFV